MHTKNNTTTRIHLSYPIPYNAIHRYCATIRGKSFATSSLFCEQRRHIERHEHPCLSLISLRFVRAKIKSSLSYLRSFANEDKARESCSFIRLIFLPLIENVSIVERAKSFVYEDSYAYLNDGLGSVRAIRCVARRTKALMIIFLSQTHRLRFIYWIYGASICANNIFSTPSFLLIVCETVSNFLMTWWYVSIDTTRCLFN